MKELYKYLALLNSKGEPSGHKLTALACTAMLAYLHYKFVNSANVVTVIVIDWLVVLLCLGRITFEQILQFKNGNKDEKAEV